MGLMADQRYIGLTFKPIDYIIRLSTGQKLTIKALRIFMPDIANIVVPGHYLLL